MTDENKDRFQPHYIILVHGNMPVSINNRSKASCCASVGTSPWQKGALGGKQEPPDTEPTTRLDAVFQLLWARTGGGGEVVCGLPGVPVFDGRYKELDPSTDLVFLIFSFPGRRMYKTPKGSSRNFHFAC